MNSFGAEDRPSRRGSRPGRGRFGGAVHLRWHRHPAADDGRGHRLGQGQTRPLYPLVPFSSRIRDGRLVFEGETFHLARNWPGVGHPMHGDGWAHTWTIERHDETSADIVYEHERADEQGGGRSAIGAAALSPRGRQVHGAISIENLEDRPVPAGLGLHPFFVRDPDSTLTCRTAFAWRADAEVLPIERIPVPPDGTSRRPPSRQRCARQLLDGWDGRATIAWPARRLRLEIEASTPFRHLVIYMPPGQPSSASSR